MKCRKKATGIILESYRYRSVIMRRNLENAPEWVRWALEDGQIMFLQDSMKVAGKYGTLSGGAYDYIIAEDDGYLSICPEDMYWDFYEDLKEEESK